MFLEIGTDMDHVHFLVQAIPMYSPKKIVQTIKSITAQEIFRRVPSAKKALWGGEFWSKDYFINTVGQFGNEKSIMEYVKKQGREKSIRNCIVNNSCCSVRIPRSLLRGSSLKRKLVISPYDDKVFCPSFPKPVWVVLKKYF